MSLGLKKSTLTRTINASRKLPASAGKYPPVTCGNRRQSVHAENFAASAGYFTCETVYLLPTQANLHAAVLQYSI